MKLKLTAFLLAVLTFILVSCGNEKDSIATPDEIMNGIDIVIAEKEAADGKTYRGSGNLYRSSSAVEGEFLTEGQISVFYGDLAGAPDFTVMESYSVWISSDNSATEIGVFKLKNTADADNVRNFLNLRVSNLKSTAHGYSAEEEEKAENAVINSNGNFVYYIVTSINQPIEDRITALIEAGRK